MSQKKEKANNNEDGGRSAETLPVESRWRESANGEIRRWRARRAWALHERACHSRNPRRASTSGSAAIGVSEWLVCVFVRFDAHGPNRSPGFEAAPQRSHPDDG